MRQLCSNKGGQLSKCSGGRGKGRRACCSSGRGGSGRELAMPQLTLTQLPPMYTSCLLIIAAPHMTQSKSLIQSWADFLFFLFSAAVERKNVSVCHKEKGNMGCSHALPPTADEFNCGWVREGKGGRRVEFLSIWLCHKDPWTWANGGKQTKPPVGQRGGNSATVKGICTRWAHMWSPDSDERWISWRFARNDQHHSDILIWRRCEMHLPFGCGRLFTR